MASLRWCHGSAFKHICKVSLIWAISLRQLHLAVWIIWPSSYRPVAPTGWHTFLSRQGNAHCSHQSVCWSSITSRSLALLETPARSAASDKVAAAAAVVCLTALDSDEKKPELPPPVCGWLVDWRLSVGPGDTAGLCCGGSGRWRSVM